MSIPHEPRKKDQPGTYIVPDRQNKDELARLTVQDHLVTRGMGGVFPEQDDPTSFQRVLDIGCGPGGWMIDAAIAYPAMSLVGIDISPRMIEAARAEAQARNVAERITLYVVDALRKFDFPDASFDLVNMRFGSSFLRTWEWPRLISELLRVTRPRGVVRVTDAEIVHESNSDALKQFQEMLQCAYYRAGHLFSEASTGITVHLPQVLSQYGCQHVKTQGYMLSFQAGTPEGQLYYESTAQGFQTLRPFLQKWGCLSLDYDGIVQLALHDMQQPQFQLTWHIVTTWGMRRVPALL